MQPFEHGGNIYSIKRDRSVHELIDFSANINPLGLNKAIERAIYDNIHTVVHYPDPQAHELRQAIIAHYAVQNEQLVLGNGAAELIYLYARVSGKQQAVLLHPCFSEYERACKSADMPIKRIYLQEADDFAIDYEYLLENIQTNSIVFLANPNNPTGGLLDKERVQQLLEVAALKGTDIFIDESFIDFVEDSHSCASLMQDFDNLVILHSLTKIFALPGLRIGFGLFNTRIATLIEAAKDVWNVNSLAQAAGKVALEQHEYLQQTRATVKQLREEFCTELGKFEQLKVYKGSVNFILLRLCCSMTAGEFRNKMLEQGILVRDCSNYPGLDNQFVRIAVRVEQENKAFIQALHNVF